jgi:hypothetical protein
MTINTKNEKRLTPALVALLDALESELLSANPLQTVESLNMFCAKTACKSEDMAAKLSHFCAEGLLVRSLRGGRLLEISKQIPVFLAIRRIIVYIAGTLKHKDPEKPTTPDNRRPSNTIFNVYGSLLVYHALYPKGRWEPRGSLGPPGLPPGSRRGSLELGEVSRTSSCCLQRLTGPCKAGRLFTGLFQAGLL